MYFWWNILTDCVVVCTAIQLLVIFHGFLFSFFNFIFSFRYCCTTVTHWCFHFFTALLLCCCVSFCALLDGVCLSGNKRITYFSYLLTLTQRRRQWGPAPWIKSASLPLARGLTRQNKRFTIEEIIKIVATRCQIVRLKCTKSFVGLGSAPDPAGGAYGAPSDP